MMNIVLSFIKISQLVASREIGVNGPGWSSLPG